MVSRKKLLVTIIVICGLVLGYPIFLRDKLGTALAQDIPTPTPELGPTASPAESIVPTEAPAVTQMPQESQQMPALPVVLPPFWLEFEQLVQSYDPGFTTPKDSALVPWAVFGGTIVLLLLLLAGLIGLIWFLSKLRKKPELRVPEPVQNFTRPTQPAPRKIDFVPAWIKKLGKTDILTVSTSEKEDGLQETIWSVIQTNCLEKSASKPRP